MHHYGHPHLCYKIYCDKHEEGICIYSGEVPCESSKVVDIELDDICQECQNRFICLTD